MVKEKYHLEFQVIELELKRIQNVLYVQWSKGNLLYVGKNTNEIFFVVFDKKQFLIKDINDNIVARGHSKSLHNIIFRIICTNILII
jgi:hypothetical protein